MNTLNKNPTPDYFNTLKDIFEDEAEQGSALLLLSHYRMGSSSYYLLKDYKQLESAHQGRILNTLDTKTALAVHPAPYLLMYTGDFVAGVLDLILDMGNNWDFVFRTNPEDINLDLLDLWEDYKLHRNKYIEIYKLPLYDQFKYQVL